MPAYRASLPRKYIQMEMKKENSYNRIVSREALRFAC
jgi:hypothetical protein